jgi:hypothetical protein
LQAAPQQRGMDPGQRRRDRQAFSSMNRLLESPSRQMAGL